MGFWDIFGRMIVGKPAFQPPQKDENWDDDAPTTDYAEDRQAKREAGTQSLYDEKGYKHPPVVAACNARTDINDQSFDLWVTLQNQSNRSINLDKLIIFGTTFRLSYPLHAGDQRVFKVYTGPLLKHDNYHKADLYYRDDPSGDYFHAEHMIEYHYEHDWYVVTGLALLQPIKDI